MKYAKLVQPVSKGAKAVAPGLALAVIGITAWLVYTLANGPSHFGDTPSYLALADWLQQGRLRSSERTPGYPIFLVACRLLAAALGVDAEVVVAVTQVLLLTGLCTILLYNLAYRLTGNIPVASLTAALFIGDADVHTFSAAIMSEPLALTLVVSMVWLRIRDGSWWRAGWVASLLVMTRPLYLFVPLLFAGIELFKKRRPAALITTCLPTLVLTTVWTIACVRAGADPLTPFATFGARHTFAKVYEFDLWQGLPEGPERRIISEERRAGHDVYEAVSRLATERGVGAVYEVAGQAFRAEPVRFVLAVARALPRAFRQSCLWRPNHAQPRVFGATVTWNAWYRGALYWPVPLLAVFIILLMDATWAGLGWPCVGPAFRAVITPFIIGTFLATAVLAMGTDQVGRLAMAFRPFYCLLLALAAVRLAQRRHATAGQAATSPLPSA